MFDFGLRIRQLRERNKMSQEELGRRVGRSKSVISSYENNIKIQPLDVLVEIALVFNVSLDYLVGIDKKEMISANGLSERQRTVIENTVMVLRIKPPRKRVCLSGS
ncbi:MAG: helix-turn-helix transcriptional regulator [Firmicutes bacterium]|nr:helix-turn-helix transcriptional regulator [Bacillota bacterium]